MKKNIDMVSRANKRAKPTKDQVVDLRVKRPDIESQLRQIDKEHSAHRNKSSGTSWMHFVKYNNAFLILIVAGIVAFSGLAIASDDIRESTIGSKNVYAQGVDNTLLLEADLDNFNMDFQIIRIIEDEESYIVTYSYVDLALTPQPPEALRDEGEYADGIWQYIEKEVTREIKKPFRKDLGLYLAEELSEEASARIKELKALQKKAQAEGETKIIQITEYSGLIGRVLDMGSKMFPGYEPVKKIELETPEVDIEAANRTTVSPPDNLTTVYNNWVEEHPEEYAVLNREEYDVSTDNIDEETATSTDEVIVEGGEVATSTEEASAENAEGAESTEGVEGSEEETESTNTESTEGSTGSIDTEQAEPELASEPESELPPEDAGQAEAVSEPPAEE